MTDFAKQVIEDYQNCTCDADCAHCKAIYKMPKLECSYCEFLRYHGKLVIEKMEEFMNNMM